MVLDANGRRVALLARPGLARERLSNVLQEAGANCVISADPTQLKPEELLGLSPEVVVVALDPLTEEALEQFDEVLGDRSVEVIYEEAEQAAAREGWDAARWQRHLVAKLQGHSNVLPPGREPEGDESAAPENVEPENSEHRREQASAFDPVSAEMDGFELHAGFAPFDPSSSELALSLGQSPDAPGSSAGSVAVDLAAWDDVAPSASPDDPFSGFDFTLDPAAPTSNQDDPANAPIMGVFDDPETFGQPDPFAAEPPVADAGPANGASDFSALSLHEEGTDEIDPAQAAAARTGFARDLSDLEQRISGLSLVDDTPRRGPAATGAVLILSGIGGPDAVRQLLGALPNGFERPVLVQQRLEGGRYDRLVVQLQRATKLTVTLAEPGQTAEAGKVYILSDSIGATCEQAGIRFSDDAGDAVMAALPSSDSAVLLLSGSDPSHVDAAMAHSTAGALVAGQAADGCYDAAAPDALAARGGDIAAPAALAQRLIARWSTRGTFNVQA